MVWSRLSWSIGQASVVLVAVTCAGSLFNGSRNGLRRNTFVKSPTLGPHHNLEDGCPLLRSIVWANGLEARTSLTTFQLSSVNCVGGWRSSFVTTPEGACCGQLCRNNQSQAPMPVGKQVILCKQVISEKTSRRQSVSSQNCRVKALAHRTNVGRRA
jgi:hypothetical protein